MPFVILLLGLDLYEAGDVWLQKCSSQVSAKTTTSIDSDAEHIVNQIGNSNGRQIMDTMSVDDRLWSLPLSIPVDSTFWLVQSRTQSYSSALLINIAHAHNLSRVLLGQSTSRLTARMDCPPVVTQVQLERKVSHPTHFLVSQSSVSCRICF